MFRSTTQAAALAAIILAAGLSGPAAAQTAAAPDGSYKVAQSCGWYVVLGCFKRYRAAENRANNIGAYVVDTNNYPNFRNGWFCAVDGPHSKRRARQLRRAWRGTVSDAYAKSAC